MLAGMAWLQKQGNIWWVGWRLNGQQFRKSTKETVRAEAEKHLAEIEALEAARARNALTSDYFAAVTGRPVEKVTASKFLASWLKESQADTTTSTMNKYRQVIREFSAFAEIDSKGLFMDDITVEHVSGFLTEKRKQLAPGTVKGYRRILSSVFLLAANRGLIKGNPVALAKGKKKSGEELTTKKRPFTHTELKSLLLKATPFWRYMLTAGFYTGQSLGDVITLRAENCDLAAGIVTVIRRKTGKQVIIPLSAPLRKLLLSIWPKGGKGYFWPAEAEKYLKVGPSQFSQDFYDLLADCGLVPHRQYGKGAENFRSVKRSPQKLGYHNLRHTFVTELKRAGAVDSIAKELAGHSSTAVNTAYTHLPVDTLAKAIKKLPEVFK